MIRRVVVLVIMERKRNTIVCVEMEAKISIQMVMKTTSILFHFECGF